MKEKLYLELTNKIETLLHTIVHKYELSDKEKQEVMDTVFRETKIERLG